MTANLLQRTGLGWRYTLAQEFWFYFRTCRNWRAVIRARRRGAPLSQIETRSGQVIGFEGMPPFIIFNEIWNHHMYFPPRGLARDETPRTVIDIGANIGIFTLYLKARWRGARVYAFEPVPQNFKWLANNVQSSDVQGVSLFPLAVSRTGNKQTLYIRSDAGMHSFYPNLFTDQNVAAISVESINLETLFERCAIDCADLLKLDCEGAEFQILQGQAQLLSKRVKTIVMEYHEVDGFTRGDLTNLLDSAGFVWRDIPNVEWKSGVLLARNPAWADAP